MSSHGRAHLPIPLFNQPRFDLEASRQQPRKPQNRLSSARSHKSNASRCGGHQWIHLQKPLSYLESLQLALPRFKNLQTTEGINRAPALRLINSDIQNISETAIAQLRLQPVGSRSRKIENIDEKGTFTQGSERLVPTNNKRDRKENCPEIEMVGKRDYVNVVRSSEAIEDFSGKARGRTVRTPPFVTVSRFHVKSTVHGIKYDVMDDMHRRSPLLFA